MAERVSNERLAKMCIYADSLLPGRSHDECERLMLDLRDARAELAALRAERPRLVEEAVRAGAEAVYELIRAPGEMKIADVADRVLADFDAERGK